MCRYGPSEHVGKAERSTVSRPSHLLSTPARGAAVGQTNNRVHFISQHNRGSTLSEAGIAAAIDTCMERGGGKQQKLGNLRQRIVDLNFFGRIVDSDPSLEIRFSIISIHFLLFFMCGRKSGNDHHV